MFEMKLKGIKIDWVNIWIKLLNDKKKIIFLFLINKYFVYKDYIGWCL